MAWYSGMEGGNALARILFGEVNPSGKIPFSIPKDENDLPYFRKDIDEIEYGYYHGYTLFDKKGIEPAFPFGFGLSYADFNYDNLVVSVEDDEIVARVNLNNIGNVSGEEIVQLYVGFENSKVDRPVKILRGFKKVHLDQGESKAVDIRVSKNQLKYYEPELKEWIFEDIRYKIYVGPSSDSAKLLNGVIKF
jgi:beta-glucosidase